MNIWTIKYNQKWRYFPPPKQEELNINITSVLMGFHDFF